MEFLHVSEYFDKDKETRHITITINFYDAFGNLFHVIVFVL